MPDPKPGFNLVIGYDDTPPSFNHVGSRGGQMAFHRKKKEWQRTFETLMLTTGFPRDWKYIKAIVRLTFPERRKRDEGNFRTLIEKSLADALVNGKWIPDDDPDHFWLERVIFEQQVGKPKTVVELVAE